MTEKAKYTQKAPSLGNAKVRSLGFIALTVAFIAALVIVNFLPYSGVLTLIVFGVGAIAIHRLLSSTVFDITYSLYENKLVFIRKYGRMEWECEVFPFDEAKFYVDKIEHRGKTYAFYPDDKLKEFLGI